MDWKHTQFSGLKTHPWHVVQTLCSLPGPCTQPVGRVKCLVMRSHRSALTSSCLSREILRVSSYFWLPCYVQPASRCAGFSEWRRRPLMLAQCNKGSRLTAGLNKECPADVEAIWAPLPTVEGIYSAAENGWGLSLNPAQFLSLSHTLCKFY